MDTGWHKSLKNGKEVKMAKKEGSTETENQGDKSTETENQGIEFDDGKEEVDKKPETPEGESSETEGGEINQEAIQKKIDKLTFKRYEEREKREEAEQKLAEAKEQLKKYTQESETVEIPPVPDPYDEKYKEKLQAREEALQKQASIDAQKKLEEERHNEALIAKQEAVKKEIQKNVNNMYTSAEKMGFKKEDFQEAEQKVGKFISNRPEIAQFILRQKDASLIVQYLSSNVESLEKITRLSDVDASAFIASTVADNAKALKPKPSNTPDPLKIVDGKGGGSDESPYLSGVEFE